MNRLLLIALLCAAFMTQSYASLPPYDKNAVAQNFKNKSYQDIITEVSTLEDAQRYCESCLTYTKDKDQFGKEEYWQSFKQLNDRRKGDCEDGAFAIGAMLHDNNMPLEFMSLKAGSQYSWLNIYDARVSDYVNHMVFLHHPPQGRFGAGGIGVSDYREPLFSSRKELARSFDAIYGSYQIFLLNSGDSVMQSFITSGSDINGRDVFWFYPKYSSLTQEEEIKLLFFGNYRNPLTWSTPVLADGILWITLSSMVLVFFVLLISKWLIGSRILNLYLFFMWLSLPLSIFITEHHIYVNNDYVVNNTTIANWTMSSVIIFKGLCLLSVLVLFIQSAFREDREDHSETRRMRFTLPTIEL